MKMSGEIRVRTDKKFQGLYNDLKNRAFGDMHEIFFFCVCLGYRQKRKRALGRNGDERFWSKTITPEEYVCYYSILLEENDMNFAVIQDDQKVISQMEQYANGGMDFLIEDFLHNYLIQASNELALDSSASQELAKELLGYVFEQQI